MRAGLAGAAAAILLAAAPPAAPRAIQQAAATSVTITVSGLRSDKGVVRACMTSSKSAFPKCRRDPDAHRAVIKAAPEMRIRFENVRPGEYAVALLHDENENGKADRVLGMAPREGFGFSRDAPVRMAPPEWDDAVIRIGSAPMRMAIRMRYML
ncbi:DUF2141 domain-containing protein [Qipengyuania nanhaisediminis]|uniref:DUF2141 domain-containing protein n=1 Tax=Qipengyuania nanhaisediminis TaxID=604088 RepID=UPI0038B25F06